ncbi:25958_t:CDS:2 [Dentiscutata erythropus]|uniref:25958_t:CDS:1 n=1 Tax=Dentiscutata erythropus TaxID=1348616 RepID=A0A9N9A9S9_9GLOM|nr:25958_t:CDS:2 [Dentiscutata erythropus]
MSQSSRPQRLCTNCQTRHRRCERLSERDVCTYCRRYGLNCITTPGRRRRRRPRSPRTTEAFYSFEIVMSFISQRQMPDDQNIKSFIDQEPTSNHQNTTLINPYETTTSNFGISHAYNHITIIPSFGLLTHSLTKDRC